MRYRNTQAGGEPEEDLNIGRVLLEPPARPAPPPAGQPEQARRQRQALEALRQFKRTLE